jgi:hypothetical protein
VIGACERGGSDGRNFNLRVHTPIAPIFMGIDRSVNELSNSGVDLVNRG